MKTNPTGCISFIMQNHQTCVINYVNNFDLYKTGVTVIISFGKKQCKVQKNISQNKIKSTKIE